MDSGQPDFDSAGSARSLMHGCGMADRVVTEHRTLAQPNRTLIAHHGRASRRASSSDVTRPPGWPSVKVVSKGNVTPAIDVARASTPAKLANRPWSSITSARPALAAPRSGETALAKPRLIPLESSMRTVRQAATCLTRRHGPLRVTPGCRTEPMKVCFPIVPGPWTSQSVWCAHPDPGQASNHSLPTTLTKSSGLSRGLKSFWTSHLSGAWWSLLPNAEMIPA
jgi:hypothetical protein